MKLKNLLYAVLIAAMGYGLIFIQAFSQDTKPKDGKTIFMDSRCSQCHSIKSQTIEAKRKDAGNKAPDLSDVGSKLKADFIMKYLKKEVTLDDKKHLIEFKGTDADLDILSKWLVTLVEKK